MILSQTYIYAVQLGTFIAGCIVGIFPLAVCIRKRRLGIGIVLMLLSGVLALGSTIAAFLFSVIVGIISIKML